MSNFGGQIPNKYFLLFLFLITIPLNETNPNKEAQVCHLEIYTQSRDHKERLEKAFVDVHVQATLLSDKPDCSIFRVFTKLSWKNLLKSPEVIKIVRMVKKGGKDRKSMQLLAHEVDMFELAKKHKSERVITIYDSMVFPETIYIRMEMGEFDLQRKLELVKIEWNRAGGYKYEDMMNDIYTIIEEMATVLADFNRYAIHFALKTENWVYVKNGFGALKLKLIDLQTAATTVEGRVLNPDQQRVYFCKERKDEAFVPTHASPEHIAFCKNRPKQGAQTQQTQSTHSLPELTAKADIWSMGVVICELLAQTPHLNEYGYQILKAVFVRMPPMESSTDEITVNANVKEEVLKKLKVKIVERMSMDQQYAEKAEELLSDNEAKMAEQILKDHNAKIAEEELLNDEEMKMLEQMVAEKEEERGLKIKMAKLKLFLRFPLVYKLLKEIFQINATKRPAPQAIREYIKQARSAKGDAGKVSVLLEHKFHEPSESNFGYVKIDQIKKVEQKNDQLLIWKISGVDEMTFCNHCFYYRPNDAKSMEDGGSVKKSAIAMEDENPEIGATALSSPRKRGAAVLPVDALPIYGTSVA